MRHGVTALCLLLVSFSVIIGNAIYQRKQFFPAVIYLTKHKPLFTVILVHCFLLLAMMAKSVCWLFFGSLQISEIDNILSRSWYTFFDMCLVLAFFQDELTTKYLLLFTVIVVVRVFHWILEERIDNMERTPVISASFHLRMTTFTLLLAFIDIFHIASFYWGTSTKQLMSLAVGAEYYIMLFGLISTTMRYILQTVNSLRETPWDRKAMYMFYVDIVVGLLRLSFYLEFAPILWAHHPFPLFIIRPIYLNFRFLRKTIRDLLASQRAIRLMNTIFQNVTVSELSASSDTVCIICREEIHIPSHGDNAQGSSNNSETVIASAVKRLPCSHIFHAACLKSWFHRQPTCPTCRMNVLSHLGHQQQQQQHQAAPSVSHPATSVPSATSGVVDSVQNAHPFPQSDQLMPNNFPIWAASAGAGQQSQSQFLPPHGTFVLPPVLIPGNLFMPGQMAPMPVPPADLAQQPDEALLRKSLEARITLLRQLHTLLDAAMIQMNAYVAAMAQIPINSPHPTATDAGESQARSVSVHTDSVQSTTLKEDEDGLDNIRKCRLEKLSKMFQPDSPTAEEKASVETSANS